MTLDPEIAPTGGFTDAADYRRRFPDGRIGSNPGLASVEAGQRILEAAISGMAAEYESWIKDS
jgi:creatinine amidohydrolase